MRGAARAAMFAVLVGAAPAQASPETRGRAVLKAQLAALADEDAFVATFAADASVLTPLGSAQARDHVGNLAAAVGFLDPHATVQRATFDHFTAGGNAQVAWFCAELQLTIASQYPGQPATIEKHTLRAIELIDLTDPAAGDKVAVAAFTAVRPLTSSGTSPLGEPTEPGPLAGLLTAPARLAGAMAESAVLFGTAADERARGADARKMLIRWSPLVFSIDSAREVHTASYGFAIANVLLSGGKASGSSKLSGFVLALPGASGGWSVVAASYGAVR